MKILLLLASRLISKHVVKGMTVTFLFAVVFFALFLITSTACAYIDYMSVMKDSFKDIVIYYNNIKIVFAILGLGAIIVIISLCGICLLLVRSLKKNGEIFPYYGFTLKHFWVVLLFMNTVFSLFGAIMGLAAVPLANILIQKMGLTFNKVTIVLYLGCIAISALAVSFFSAFALHRGEIKKSVHACSARVVPISDAALLIGIKNFIFHSSFSEIATVAVIILTLGGFVANVVEYASFLNNSDRYDIAVYAYDTSWRGELLALTNHTYSLNQNDLKMLEADGRLSLVSAREMFVLVKENDKNKRRIIGIGEKYAAAKSEFGFENSDFFTQDNISSYYRDEAVSKLKDFIIHGEFDPKKFFSGEEMIYVAYPGDFDRCVGDNIEFSALWYDENGEANRTDFSSSVGAIAEIDPEKITGFPLEYGFITSENFMDIMFPNVGYKLSYLYLNDPSRFNEINKTISSIKQRLAEEGDGYFRAENSIQDKAMSYDFSTVTKIITASVNIILMFVSLFYLISSMLVKIDEQNHMFFVLKILGMSKAKIIISIMLENLLNAFWSLIVGLTAGICCVLVSETLLEERISTLIPFKQLFSFSVLFILSVALTTFIACITHISDKSTHS
jgi:hypothetical protein